MGPPIFIGGNVSGSRVYLESGNASMGPPIFIGGNQQFVDWKIRTHWWLQWGRRFSSAEISFNVPSGKSSQELQWGRRFSSAEIRAKMRSSLLVSGASMGPPIFIGGNIRRRHPLPSKLLLLQWGRRFSSAEIKTWLQCGERRHNASMGPPIFIGGNVL